MSCECAMSCHHGIVVVIRRRTRAAERAARFRLLERAGDVVDSRTTSTSPEKSLTLRTALDRLGFATSGELAAFWNAISPGQAAQWCRQALHDGRVVKVGIDSLDGSPPRQAIAAPDWRRRLDRAKQAAAAIGERTVLLSPFDPVIRDRRRVQRLFGFDYRFEAFTPAQRRRYGYYVLPILEGSRLVGRLDPKHHRERATLEVRGIWWERGVAADRRRRARLQEALARLAAFIGASRITMPSRRRAASIIRVRQPRTGLPRGPFAPSRPCGEGQGAVAAEPARPSA